MNNLGEPVTEAEVKSMIDEADLDGDGKINFAEFKMLMSTKLNVMWSNSGNLKGLYREVEVWKLVSLIFHYSPCFIYIELTIY